VDLIYTQYSQRHSRAHLAFEAERTHRLILPDVVEIGYMNPGRWRHISETYAGLGMVPADLSLDGFLFERNPPPDPTWLYIVLAGALGLLGVVSFSAVRYRGLNRAIRREMAERARMESSLRALEKRYRILAESAPYPIVIARRDDGAVLYVNPQAARQFGVAAEAAVGRSTLEFYADPADRAALLQAVEAQGALRDYEVRLRTAQGARFWASVSVTRLLFEEQPAHFISLVEVTQRKALEERLETLVMTDELTGLFNRRYFNQRGGEEFTRACRYGTPFAILMVDVDYFKEINDSHGHNAGDQALRHLARSMQSSLRSVDIVCRLGGDEFGVLLPDTTLEGAAVLAARLRASVAEGQFEFQGRPVQFTVSLGAGAFSQHDATFDHVLKRADAALYEAKSQGRNRVQLAEDT
jgi:diguanylate cyclase (GGDEF)-like protein/PAS domain S-box-containing protein